MGERVARRRIDGRVVDVIAIRLGTVGQPVVLEHGDVGGVGGNRRERRSAHAHRGDVVGEDVVGVLPTEDGGRHRLRAAVRVDARREAPGIPRVVQAAASGPDRRHGIGARREEHAHRRGEVVRSGVDVDDQRRARTRGEHDEQERQREADASPQHGDLRGGRRSLLIGQMAPRPERFGRSSSFRAQLRETLPFQQRERRAADRERGDRGRLGQRGDVERHAAEVVARVVVADREADEAATSQTPPTPAV